MLESVDQVNWSELSHAYGVATDVPELLRAVADEDEDVRSEALYELYETIWHQGTVYEATAYAVPFLIELLLEPNVADKADILGLLYNLSTGTSYLDVHQELDSYYNKRHTAEFQTQLRIQLDWVQAAQQAVVVRTPVYLQMLSHPEAAVRSMVPYVLANCIQQSAEIEPLLRQRITAEEDSQVKASLVMGLARLWQNLRSLEPTRTALSSNQNELVFLMRQQESPVVRFAAALSLVKLGSENLLEEAISVFQQTMDVISQGTFPRPPWIDEENLLSIACKALSAYPSRRCLQWLLLQMLSHANSKLRQQAVWQIEEMCREWRSAPELVVPYLAQLIADTDRGVRQNAATSLPRLGKARFGAVTTLQTLLQHADVEVQR